MIEQDLRTLALFVAACEMRSLTRAAERSNLATSAASRRIQLLEDSAGVVLLKRRPHGVEPTDAGLTVLRYARDMLQLTDRLSGLLQEHRSGMRGLVRISASSSAMVQRLAADLSRFMAAHPEIRIELEERPTSGTLEALRSKRVDLGVVVVGGDDLRDVEQVPFGGDRLVVVVPSAHPLAPAGPIRFDHVVREELVTLDGSTAIRRLLMDRARASGQYLRVRVQVSSFEAAGLMVGQGLGIAVLPEHAIRPLTEAFGLVTLPLDEDWAVRDFAICVRRLAELDGPTRRLLAFLTSGPD